MKRTGSQFCECRECDAVKNGVKPHSSRTVDSVVGFTIPTSYEEYLLLTDEQKFLLYEITKTNNKE